MDDFAHSGFAFIRCGAIWLQQISILDDFAIDLERFGYSEWVFHLGRFSLAEDLPSFDLERFGHSGFSLGGLRCSFESGFGKVGARVECERGAKQNESDLRGWRKYVYRVRIRSFIFFFFFFFGSAIKEHSWDHRRLREKRDPSFKNIF